MITREFNLYLHAGHSIPLVINVNQYDRGEQWLFTLFNSDGTKYVPSSGAIVGIKSDKLGIINSGTVDSQGRVVINETQQMTAAVGKAVFELLIDDQTHGTANFVVLVEPKPGDNADLSESDLSLIQQAIDGTSATAIAQGVSDWMDENLTPTTPVVDQSLTVQGAAADSAKVGQELSDLKSQISSKSGLTNEFKVALENLVNQIVYKGDDPTGRTYIDALHTAMYPPNSLSRIGAVYSGGVVYESDSLDDLKDNLTVTAYYDDESSTSVTDYALSGTLTIGVSTITVTYMGKTTTFNVRVADPSEYHLTTPFKSTSKKLLDGVTPFADGEPVTILFEFSLNAGGTMTNGVRLYGLDGDLWSVGVGSMYGRSTAGGSTSSGIWFYAKEYGVKLCATGGLVKNTDYRIAMTYDPTNLLVTVYFKGGTFDVTGTIQLSEALVYSNTLGFNTGTYTKEMNVQKFDVYYSVLDQSEISAFMDAE